MHAKPTEPLTLPAPVARYFTLETSDPQALARLFSDHAVVRDEGQEHHGRSAIAAWNAAAVSKFSFKSEPIRAETAGDHTTVTARLTGSFPGSPLQLRLHFTVSNELISRLEIAP